MFKRRIYLAFCVRWWQTFQTFKMSVCHWGFIRKIVCQGAEQYIPPVYTQASLWNYSGECIEYFFGLLKRFYRSLKIEDKKTKHKFVEAVRRSVNFVKREHVNRFAATCRQYMLAYMHLDGELTYSIIEKFQWKFKTHRNIANKETRLLPKVWIKGILIE